MGPKSLLPISQEPATFPFRRPDESRSLPPISQIFALPCHSSGVMGTWMGNTVLYGQLSFSVNPNNKFCYNINKY